MSLDLRRQGVVPLSCSVGHRNAHPTLKVGMSSSPEIHGFSPGGFQYGVFRISVRIPIFAMAKMGRVSGFWRFLGKCLGTEQKLPYWEPTGESPWISGPEYIRTLRVGCILARKSTGFCQADFSTVFFGFQYGYRFSPWRKCRRGAFHFW